MKRFDQSDDEREGRQDDESRKSRKQRAGDQEVIKGADDTAIDPGDDADPSTRRRLPPAAHHRGDDLRHLVLPRPQTPKIR